MTRDDILPYLDDLTHRRRTNIEVAKEIGVTPETVSRVLRQLNVKKIPGVIKTQKAAIKQLTKARYEYRRQAAKTMTLEQAMAATGLTERSVRRWRAK